MDDFVASPRWLVPLLCALLLSSPPAFAQAQVPSDASEKVVAEETATDGTPTEGVGTGTESAEGPATSDKTSVDGTATVETEGTALDTAPASEETVGEDVTGPGPGEREPGPEHAPALIDAPEGAPLEDEDDWLKWPFSKKNQRYPKQSEPHRWGGGGGFLGWVSRPSQSDSIKYRPGIAWGGYVRAELVSWLGLRLFYREERVPVQVESGAFDFGDDTYEDDFEQPDLEILNLGARLEPTLVVHPRLRVRGIVGWSWLWFQAPFPKSEDFELKRTFRSAVQMDISVGAGLSFDIIKNWIDISLDSAYSVPAGRTGTAYEPAQIVRDGGIHHIAPMPKLQNSLDCLISLGVIL